MSDSTGAERPVVDDAERHRFVLEVDGRESELVYRIRGNRLVLLHTGVPEAIGGRGIGGRLVEAAVERARRDGLTVVPLCPFTDDWIRRHPERAATVTVERA